MRLKFLIASIALIVLASPSLSLSESNHAGHAAFFAVGFNENWQDKDALDDFLYYYSKITPWLDKTGVAHSYSEEFPIVFSIGEITKKFQPEDLDMELGLILADKDGNTKVLYGVLTGVDWQIEIRNFLDIQ